MIVICLRFVKRSNHVCVELGKLNVWLIIFIENF